MSGKPAPRALVVGASETAALLHLPVLARLRDQARLELVEICDLRQTSAAAARQRFGFGSDSGDAVAAIARDDIDVVYLFGSARMHHMLGLDALRAGKHLFVEKPIAPSFAGAMQLADAAEARGLIAVGGHNRRFLAAFDRIRAEAGESQWSLAEAVFHKPEFAKPPPFGAATWLSGNGIHALDALLFMMGGLPEWVSAQAGGAGPAPIIFTATMRWPSGAQGVLLCNNEAGARREEYVFHAPGESWRVEDVGLTIERGGVSTFVDLPAAGDGFAAEHEAFLDAIGTGVPPRHAIAALAPSLFLAELIEAGHHGPVRLPSKRMAAAAPRTHAVLIANADRLRTALGAVPENWRLISIEELEKSDEVRPDITAAILGPGAAPISAPTLDKLPNLAIVGVAALSLQRYGADQLLDRGIAVVNASHAYAESVAEFALGLAILGRRRAFVSDGIMHGGGWGATPKSAGLAAFARRAGLALRPMAAQLGVEIRLRHAWRSVAPRAGLAPVPSSGPRELRGATVGLVGWGASARAFAARLKSVGAGVVAWSEHASAEDIRAAGVKPATVAEALAADIVSLHRGLTPATRHFLGAAELARLRSGGVLINVARGALIEPGALIARLKRGDIFACLDTFEEEPLPRRHPLRRLRNVFLTAHIAGGSPDMHAAAIIEVIDKVRSHLDGVAVETVTAGRLATMT
jgi:phosphoglycerate dehydrogenase-like enzyme/predicted dehydrogenase